MHGTMWPDCPACRHGRMRLLFGGKEHLQRSEGSREFLSGYGWMRDKHLVEFKEKMRGAASIWRGDQVGGELSMEEASSE